MVNLKKLIGATLFAGFIAYHWIPFAPNRVSYQASSDAGPNKAAVYVDTKRHFDDLGRLIISPREFLCESPLAAEELADHINNYAAQHNIPINDELVRRTYRALNTDSREGLTRDEVRQFNIRMEDH